MDSSSDVFHMITLLRNREPDIVENIWSFVSPWLDILEEFTEKRKRRLALKYWLKWTAYLMDPTTERGQRYWDRQFDKLYKI